MNNENPLEDELREAEQDRLSGAAKLVLQLLPYGGHVRLTQTLSGRVEIEGFTVEQSHLASFFRASGSSRVEAQDLATSALSELILRGLAQVYQDTNEPPRYALTAQGRKVQLALLGGGS